MERDTSKVAIIGAGNMGGAIARGLSSSGRINQDHIRVSDINPDLLQQVKSLAPGITVNTSNVSIVEGADVIIMAVKPWLLEQVASELKEIIDYRKQVVVSIAAGIDFKQLTNYFNPGATLFRVIPNTAIDVMQSASTISSHNATREQQAFIEKLFSSLGKVFFVPEWQLNAYMSLSSCGIAYAFRYIRAAMQGGVEMGIPAQTSKAVVVQTLRGAIELLEANDAHPEIEIDKVTTPGGITIKGLNEMEANGFTNAVIKGLKASHIK